MRIIKILLLMLLIILIDRRANGQVYLADKTDKPYYIINDELTNQWIKNLLSKLKSSTFKIEEKPVNNIHNSRITDTIKILKSGRTEIEFYITEDRLILQSAIILDTTIVLDNKIKVGISKETLSKAAKEEISNDLLRIGNLEGQQYFEFKFKNEILYSIIYCGIPD